MDIDYAIEKLVTIEEAESIVGVCKTEAVHPAFLTKIIRGFLAPYTNEMKAVRRQDLEDLYFFEGSVYVVPKWKSFEIDDFIDFKIIETLMDLKLKGIIK